MTKSLKIMTEMFGISESQPGQERKKRASEPDMPPEFGSKLRRPKEKDRSKDVNHGMLSATGDEDPYEPTGGGGDDAPKPFTPSSRSTHDPRYLNPRDIAPGPVGPTAMGPSDDVSLAPKGKGPSAPEPAGDSGGQGLRITGDPATLGILEQALELLSHDGAEDDAAWADEALRAIGTALRKGAGNVTLPRFQATPDLDSFDDDTGADDDDYED